MKDHTIVIADDNSGMRRLLVLCLESPERRLLCAPDGDSALSLARATLPDLVILDVSMPGRDGLQVRAALRADERTRSIPVLLVSGLFSAESEDDGVGPDAFLAKPFQPRELDARVSRLLRKPS